MKKDNYYDSETRSQLEALEKEMKEIAAKKNKKKAEIKANGKKKQVKQIEKLCETLSGRFGEDAKDDFDLLGETDASKICDMFSIGFYLYKELRSMQIEFNIDIERMKRFYTENAEKLYRNISVPQPKETFETNERPKEIGQKSKEVGKL